MPSGGARPGSGRPRLADKYESEIGAAEKKIADKLPWLVDKMMELAAGITMMEPGRDGEEIIYTRAPDRQALEYLLNRIMGKPTDRHEHEFASLSDEDLIEAATRALAGVETARP